MKLQPNKFGKKLLVVGLSFLLALPVAAFLDNPAEAESNQEETTQAQSNSLANRDSIKLPIDLQWVDGENFMHTKLVHYNQKVACNSPFGSNNTQRNHFGLYTHPQDLRASSSSGHAWAFSVEWHADKGAYTVRAEMPTADGGELDFTNCTFKYWNLTGKKKSAHTKIQTWTNGAKKDENLFWLAWSNGNPGDKELTVRFYSALSGLPVGFKAGDYSNLQTLDENDLNTEGVVSYFTMSALTYGDV